MAARVRSPPNALVPGPSSRVSFPVVKERSTRYWHSRDTSQCPLHRRFWSITGRPTPVFGMNEYTAHTAVDRPEYRHPDACYTVPENFDLLVFQILVASIHLPPTSRQSMAYLPVISRCGWLLALSVTTYRARRARRSALGESVVFAAISGRSRDN